MRPTAKTKTPAWHCALEWACFLGLMALLATSISWGKAIHEFSVAASQGTSDTPHLSFHLQHCDGSCNPAAHLGDPIDRELEQVKSYGASHSGN
jgi:hypothetical protein